MGCPLLTLLRREQHPSSYDGVGNVMSMTDSVMGSWTYNYDHLNRSSSATDTTCGTGQMTLSWSIDPFGNRLSQSASASGTGPCVNTSASQPNLTVNGNNQVVGFAYDADGRVTQDSVNKYLYDGEGRLCAVDSTGGVTEYVYDGEGRVVSLNNGATTYVYDAEGRRVAKGGASAANYLLGLGGEQVTELTPSGGWVHSNVWIGGKLLGTYEGPSGSDTAGYHFPLTDWLGTKRVGTYSTGLSEETCVSYPFGDGLSCSVPNPTEHHFTGKERDAESGNDYFDARYYSSTMGRFLSPDWSAKVAPVPYAKLDNPQSLNLYAYVGNNPLDRTDPTGHYTAGCGGDVKNCDKQIGNLDKQLQSALKSKDPKIVKAAQAYGKLGDKNGVNVTFLNVVDPKHSNVVGNTGAQAGTGGIRVDQPTGTVQQATQVNLQAGMGGSQLQETAVHEGVHVEDRANFVDTIKMTPYAFDQSLNITNRQSEVNAYGVENEWRDANGLPALDVNNILSHPPYSDDPSIDKPILPDFPGSQ